MCNLYVISSNSRSVVNQEVSLTALLFTLLDELESGGREVMIATQINENAKGVAGGKNSHHGIMWQ